MSELLSRCKDLIAAVECVTRTVYRSRVGRDVQFHTNEDSLDALRDALFHARLAVVESENLESKG